MFAFFVWFLFCIDIFCLLQLFFNFFFFWYFFFKWYSCICFICNSSNIQMNFNWRSGLDNFFFFAYEYIFWFELWTTTRCLGGNRFLVGDILGFRAKNKIYFLIEHVPRSNKLNHKIFSIFFNYFPFFSIIQKSPIFHVVLMYVVNRNFTIFFISIFWDKKKIGIFWAKVITFCTSRQTYLHQKHSVLFWVLGFTWVFSESIVNFEKANLK